MFIFKQASASASSTPAASASASVLPGPASASSSSPLPAVPTPAPMPAAFTPSPIASPSAAVTPPSSPASAVSTTLSDPDRLEPPRLCRPLSRPLAGCHRHPGGAKQGRRRHCLLLSRPPVLSSVTDICFTALLKKKKLIQKYLNYSLLE